MSSCLCIGTTLREEAAAEVRKGHGREGRAQVLCASRVAAADL